MADQRAGLTVREYQLLAVLVSRRNRVLQRGEIFAAVWGGTMRHRDRSVDVVVRKIRSKLERVAPGWRYIHTHFGVGYRFHPERVAPAAADPSSAGPAAAPRRGDLTELRVV